MDLDRDLLASVSHELRGPLNGVLGLSSLLLNGTYGALSERQRTAVEMIELSGRNLLARIDSVVAYVGLVAQPPHPTKADTDLRELVDAAIGGRPGAVNDVAPGTSARVDPTIVGPVVEELVANALRNTDSSDPVIVSATAEPITIVVADRGRGIPVGKEEDVFVPFTQIHGDEGTADRSGLGLARCRILAAAHGGTITIRPGEAGGCTAVLRL